MALDGNVLANTWEGAWEDRETGKAMAAAGSRCGPCATG